MGFKVKRKVYKLVFQDPDMDGLVVLARSVPLGKLLDASADSGAGADAEVGAKQTRGMFELFAGALVSWNLEEEDGTPVPATLDGVLGQDAEFVRGLIEAWSEALTSVPGPLGKPSTSGGTSPELAIPMETL